MIINELYSRAKDGNKTAENELFNALIVRFRAIGLQRIWDKDDIEDIVQDALKTVAEEYKRIEITDSFSAWAAKVLDYKILAYIKKKQTRQAYAGNMPPDETLLSEPQLSSDLKLQLIRCLKRLSENKPKYARILNLHYQGYSVEEVCRQLGITPSNSYVILSRARILLVKCLEEKQED
ncbi:MAG: RNA polymerase sigma factor [Candidatus Zixiibacteriota bacterium]